MNLVFFHREIRFAVRPAHGRERSWIAELADGTLLLVSVEQVGLEDTLIAAIHDAQKAIDEWLDEGAFSAGSA